MKRFLWREPASKWRPGLYGYSLWFYGFSFGRVAVGWIRMIPGGVKKDGHRMVPDPAVTEAGKVSP